MGFENLSGDKLIQNNPLRNIPELKVYDVGDSYTSDEGVVTMSKALSGATSNAEKTDKIINFFENVNDGLL